MHENVSSRHYSNSGNRDILGLLDLECTEILDVGCGGGDNARLLQSLGYQGNIYGITVSDSELRIASAVMKECWNEDIETSTLAVLNGRSFDAILFCHVLEHLRYPSLVINKFVPFLQPGGAILLAVPNILHWRQRVKFLLGDFEYKDDGVMDRTHLRFFTYKTADKYLVNGLKVEVKRTTNAVPLWPFRRYAKRMCARIDNLGGRLLPNLFGEQVLIKARLSGTP